MECTQSDPNCRFESENLIDFSSDSEILGTAGDIRGDIRQGRSTPLLKSADRFQMNGDVVTIKRGNGDVGFVAVGRLKSKMKSAKCKYEKNKLSTVNVSDCEYEFVEIPQGMEPYYGGGIDNPGYSTVTRSDAYLYDNTGENYFSSYPQRWANVDLMKLDTSSELEQRQPNDLYSDDPEAFADHQDGLRFREEQIVADDFPHPDPQHARHTSISSGEMLADETDPRPDSDMMPAPASMTPEVFIEQPSDDDNVDTHQLGTTGGSVSESEAEDHREEVSSAAKLPQRCKVCGQRHGVTENHEYNYIDEVDEDLTCDICLQPLVDPYDTKCGHTFCCVCIKNYLRVKHMCPIDRQEMENVSTDCWQSSLILRKLINKLMVECPHVRYCKEKMQRCDLKGHLKERCPGAMIRCPKSMYGCVYKGARISIDDHLHNCEFKDFDDKLSDLHPYSEDVTIELFRPEGTAELGIMIVGGSDTPLHYVIIQDIIEDGLAFRDGRLAVGDVIVDVNGESMFSVTHAEARAAMAKPSNLMRFGVLRNMSSKDDPNEPGSLRISRSNSAKAGYSEECVCLIKPPLEQLGIRISTSETGVKGVYIIELIIGQVAQLDGRLQVGDRILAIGATDLTESTPEHAARVIGNCDGEVEIIVRHMLPKPAVICNDHAQDPTIPKKKELGVPSLSRTPSFPPPPKPVRSSHKRKVISVTKSAKENLGIIVSGGYNSPRGNLPIFVQDVLSMSVLGTDGQIKRGDLLSEINSCKLIGLSHTQAMNILRESAQQRDVSLVAYELEYEGKNEDAALWDELTSLHQHPSKWAPSWKMWLSVTPEFTVVREVVLRKPSSANYGIKITGGFTKEHGPSPVFITNVAQKTGASKYLKCGDEIIAINKRLVKGMSYMHALNLMKSTNYVTLKVVSWPGSLH